MSKLIHGAVPEGLDRIKTKDKEVSPEGEEGQLWCEQKCLVLIWMGMISLDLELQRNKILECLFDNFSLYYKVSTELKVQCFRQNVFSFFLLSYLETASQEAVTWISNLELLLQFWLVILFKVNSVIQTEKREKKWKNNSSFIKLSRLFF